jgi:hypothetical protein
MIDLEEQFRADVQQLPQAVQLDLGVDADVLVAAGHRVRRARLLKRTAAAGALMVASALLGWAGLNTAGTRWSDPVVVGNPAPTPSTAAALIPGTSGVIVFPEGDAESPRAKGVKSVKVEAIVLEDGSYSVQFTATMTSGETRRERSTAGAEDVIWFQPSPTLIVGFVPHRFEWIQYDDEGDGTVFGGYSSNERAFDTLDASAVWRRTDQGGEYPGLRGYRWRGLDGVYRNSLGNLLPSVTISLPISRTTGRFFLDDDLGVVGLDEDGSVGSRKLGSSEVHEFLGWADADGGRATGGLVLPVGASDPVLTTKGTGLEWAQARLDGRLAVLATALMPDQSDPVVSAISFTDVNGKRVTTQFP